MSHRSQLVCAACQWAYPGHSWLFDALLTPCLLPSLHSSVCLPWQSAGLHLWACASCGRCCTSLFTHSARYPLSRCRTRIITQRVKGGGAPRHPACGCPKRHACGRLSCPRGLLPFAAWMCRGVVTHRGAEVRSPSKCARVRAVRRAREIWTRAASRCMPTGSARGARRFRLRPPRAPPFRFRQSFFSQTPVGTFGRMAIFLVNIYVHNALGSRFANKTQISGRYAF